MLYERTAISKRKLAVLAKAHQTPIILRPEDEIKDPLRSGISGAERRVFRVAHHFEDAKHPCQDWVCEP